MTSYCVLVNGRNFLVSFDGQPTRVGFYVTRIVKAASSEEAGIAAIDLIRQHLDLHSTALNQENDPPILDADEIEEAVSSNISTGFSFNPEDEPG